MIQEEEQTQNSQFDEALYSITVHFERPFWRRVLFVLREIFPALRNAWRDSRFL